MNSTAGAAGMIPDQGTKIVHAARPPPPKKKNDGVRADGRAGFRYCQ